MGLSYEGCHPEGWDALVVFFREVKSENGGGKDRKLRKSREQVSRNLTKGQANI